MSALATAARDALELTAVRLSGGLEVLSVRTVPVSQILSI